MTFAEAIRNGIGWLSRVRDRELRALHAALVNARAEATALQEKLARLQEENAQLRSQLLSRDESARLTEQLYYARSVYWRKDEADNWAYCPICFDTRGKLVRLIHGDMRGTCPTCGDTRFLPYSGGKPKPGD